MRKLFFGFIGSTPAFKRKTPADAHTHERSVKTQSRISRGKSLSVELNPSLPLSLYSVSQEQPLILVRNGHNNNNAPPDWRTIRSRSRDCSEFASNWTYPDRLWRKVTDVQVKLPFLFSTLSSNVDRKIACTSKVNSKNLLRASKTNLIGFRT